jgi:phenylacetate-CoA ligase
MNYYDSLETRSPVAREAWLMARLPQQLELAKTKSAYWRQRLAGVAVNAIDSRAALATLPVTRKSELGELQRARTAFRWPDGDANEWLVAGLCFARSDL